MLEEFDVKALKVEDLRKMKEQIEKIPSIKTDSQHQTVFATLDKVALIAKSYSDLNGDIKSYFIDNIIYPSVNFTVNHKQYPLEYVTRVETYLEQMLALIINLIDQDHHKLSETLRAIFDPSRMFYEHNNQETDTHKYMCKELCIVKPAYLEWVATLKDNDFVDCIKHDRMASKSCWSRAQIMYRTQSDASVRFLNEKNCLQDRIVGVESAEIMPIGSRTPDYDYLLNLKVGSLVDACDTASVWINSTVLSRLETRNQYDEKVVDYMIAYRVYDTLGQQEDEDTKQRFNGWSKQYDELVRATSPKLAKYQTRAKTLYKAASVQSEETIIDDSNDEQYINEYRELKFQGILRPKQSKSASLVRLINTFGSMGGFDCILARVRDRVNWLPVNLLASYVQSIGAIHAQLYRRFVLDFVGQFKDAVQENLVSSPEGNIRNMAKERLDCIVKGVELLARRAYSLMEKFEIVESLILRLVLLCFNSNFLDKKIQALKLLIDVCKNVQSGTYKSLSVSDLLEWINQKQLFEQILNSQAHLELVVRSTDLLKFYLNTEGALTERHMDSLWSLIAMDDKEFRPIIYKVFNDVSTQMKDHHVVFFQNKMSTLSVEDLGGEQIAFLYEMNRFQSKNQPLVTQCIDILWSIVKHQSKQEMPEFFTLLHTNKGYVGKTAKDIEEKARTHVCDLFKNLDCRDNKMKLMYELLDNLKQHQAVSSSLKTLGCLVQSFPARDTEKDHLTQAVIVSELVQERHLITLLLDSITHLKQEITAHKTTEELPTAFQASYMLKLLERVLLIKTLLKINIKTSEIITLQFLQAVWSMMVMDPLCKQESDMICKWIKEMVDKEKEAQFRHIYFQFFEETFLPNSTVVCSLQLDGFDTFQTMMQRINEHIGTFKLLETGANATVNSLGQVTAMSSQQEEEKSDKPDFEYQIGAHPDSLVGIGFLWDVVYNSTKDNVVERAAQFLTKLYLNPTKELSHQRNEIQAQFIRIVLQNIINQEDATARKSQTIRSLLLLKNLLNESERLGVGTLTSLSGLVKGESMTFQITNDLTTGSDVPKKVEVKLSSNRTVMELRVVTARLLKASWDQIKLIRVNLFNQNREVPDTDNGKTLLDIRLRNGESIMIQRRATQPIPMADLVGEDKKLTKQVKDIIRVWFAEFAHDGLMSREQCVDFILKCTGEKCSIDDSRIKDTYDSYDSDKDGYLTLDDFYEFYGQAALERPYVVWKNIHAYHYRNDLRHVDEVLALEVDESTLPRYILQHHESFYDLMFGLFDEDKEVALIVWRLLNRLPASQRLLHMIVTLEGIKQHHDWSKVFPQASPYRLLYSLKIIEYLMSDDEGASADPESPTKMEIEMNQQQQELLHSQRVWRQEFIMYGGFEQLSQTFKTIVAITHKGQSSSVNQQILSFILLVMRNYLAAALKPHVNDIYKIQAYIRQTHFTLEQISTSLRLDREEQSAAVAPPVIQQQDFMSKLAEIVLPTATKQKSRVKETEDFLAMVERLKGDLGQKILETLDLQSLYQELIFIIQLYMDKEGEIESEERQIIEYGLCLLVSLILYDREGCQRRYVEGDEGKVFHFLQTGVFTSKNILIRKMFSHVLHLMSKYGLSAVNLKYMLAMFPSPHESTSTKRESSQYFDTLCNLIEECDLTPDVQQMSAVLCQRMIDLIVAHQSTERRQSIIPDKSLCGYLGLLESLLKVHPQLAAHHERFAEYLFRVCLFESDPIDKVRGKLPTLLIQDSTSKDIPPPMLLLDYLPDNYVKCKTADSRKLAYRVLVLLIRQQPAQPLKQILEQVPLTTQLNFKPALEIKSYHGYVGMKNLGSTCYMNAMIQQFFMTPAFRYAILMASDAKPPIMQPYRTREGADVLVDDNVIHQFQQIFAYLEYSDRPDYNPFKFCHAFKDYQGKPVNVAVQQDAQEFLNMIFDKLETGLADKGWKQVVEGVYGGRTCQQVICVGCHNVREQEELFYNLSVQVKGVKHIHESLKQFCAGETISDYYCEACDRKNDIIRRQCLSHLPNALIIHLQRIVFNLDTLQNEKMSNRVEFPGVLNLEPYTREGLQLREGGADIAEEDKYRLKPQDYYEYKLKGVVVHRGTAVYGHYYSYVNHKGDKWLELNDSNIKDYDPRKLAADCYGGKDSEETSEFWSKGDTSSTSAYILVYERNYKQPIKMQFKSAEDKSAVIQNVLDYLPQEHEAFEHTSDLQCNIPYNNFGRFLREDIYKEVWLDNHQFMLERHVYSEEFFAFVRDLLVAPQHDPCALENALFVLTELAARSSDTTNIKDFIAPITSLISAAPTQAYPLLKKYIIGNAKRVFECLIQSPDANVRTALGAIILHLLQVVISTHHLELRLASEDPLEQDVIKFLVFVLGQLNGDVAKNWTKLTQYLELIRNFVQGGAPQLAFSQEVQLVSILVDFFLEKGSPLWAAAPEVSPIGLDFGNKKHTMGNKFSNPMFSPLFECVAYMLNKDCALSQNDLACLHHQYFYARAMMLVYDLQPLISIMIRMCWQNGELSLTVAQTLLEAIEKANYEGIAPYTLVMVSYLSMADSLMEQRVQWMLGYAQPQFNSTLDSCACPYSLSDASMVYLSTLPGDTTLGLLSLIYNNRKRYENYTICLLRALLSIANTINTVFAYLLMLPPPSYLYAKYVDWIGEYVDTYLTESRKYQSQQVGLFNRVANGEDVLKEWTMFGDKMRDHCSFQHQSERWESVTPIYILGQTTSTKMVCEYTLSEGLTLNCLESTIFMTDSVPLRAPPSNAVFPGDVLYDHQFIQTSKIDPSSSVWNILLGQKQLQHDGIPTPPPLPIELMLINQSNLKKKREQMQHNKMEEEQERINTLMDGNNASENPTTYPQNDLDQEELSNFAAQLDDIPGANDNYQEHKPQQQKQKLQRASQDDLFKVDPIIFESNFLRRYFVNNTTEQSIYLKLNFYAENPESLNMRLTMHQYITRLPQQICKYVKPHTEMLVVCLMKMVADVEWGPYNEIATAHFESDVKAVKSNSLKTEGTQVQPSDFSSNPMMHGPNLPTSSIVNENDMKSCPQCTVLQTSLNAFCELCGADF